MCEKKVNRLLLKVFVSCEQNPKSITKNVYLSSNNIFTHFIWCDNYWLVVCHYSGIDNRIIGTARL